MTAKPDSQQSSVLTKDAWKCLLKSEESVKLTLQFLKLTTSPEEDAVAEFSDGSYIYQMQVESDSSACDLLGIVKTGALLDVWAMYIPETDELEACIGLEKIVPLKNQNPQVEIPSHLQPVPKQLELLEDSSMSVDSREFQNLLEEELGDVNFEQEQLQPEQKNTPATEQPGLLKIVPKTTQVVKSTQELQTLPSGKYTMAISLRLETVFQKMTRNNQSFFSSCIAFDEYYKVQLTVFHDAWIDFQKGKVYKFEGTLQFDEAPNKYSSFSDIPKLTVSCNMASVAPINDAQTAIPLCVSTYEKDFRHNQQKVEDLVDGGILDFKGRLWQFSEPERLKSTTNMHENFKMTLQFYGTRASIILRGSFEQLQQMREDLESECEYVVENLKYRKPKQEYSSQYSDAIRLFGAKHVVIRPTGNTSKSRSAKQLTVDQEANLEGLQESSDHSVFAMGKRNMAQLKTTDELLSALTGGKPVVWKKSPSPNLPTLDQSGNSAKLPVVVSIDE